jgi:hypothetical protein
MNNYKNGTLVYNLKIIGKNKRKMSGNIGNILKGNIKI